MQRLFHRPEQIAPVCDRHREQPLGRNAAAVEAGAVQRAAFGEA
jgi:hypothetical protein